MKLIDTHPDPKKGSLSTQVHPKQLSFASCKNRNVERLGADLYRVEQRHDRKGNHRSCGKGCLKNA